jgi:hypothetical protein
MAQIFHRSFNVLSKVSIFGAVFILAALGWAALVLARSSYITHRDIARVQPVPFSHAHHVNGLGIDCRYCHTSVEDSHFAGLPPTKTCMNCHSQIWAGSDVLEPVRDSYRTGKSIPWQRVHRLDEFCYFDHSIHVAKGVGCATAAWTRCRRSTRRAACSWNGASTVTASPRSSSGRARKSSTWTGRRPTRRHWASVSSRNTASAS